MATDLSVTRPADRGTSPRPRNLGLALAVIAVAQLMVVLDVAIVNVALPSIQRSLHFTATNLEWVVNAYAIAFGGLLLLGGRAGDLFGRRRMFIAGTILFTAGSLAGGLATTSTLLIMARVVQGIGGAIVAPTALSLLADTFAEGIATRTTFDLTFSMLKTALDDVVALGEDELREGVAAAVQYTHNLAEGAGAAPLAAARQYGPPPDATVVCVMSGGNADMRTLRHTLA